MAGLKISQLPDNSTLIGTEYVAAAQAGVTVRVTLNEIVGLVPITSFKGRTGAIVPTSGDYSFSLISGQATLAQLPTLPAYSLLGNPGSSSAAPSAATHVLFSSGGADPTTAPTQATPQSQFIGVGGVFADSGAGNIFGIASWVDNSGSRPVVGVFGQGRALGNGALAWGGNFVGYTGANGAFAQGIEIDFGTGAGTTSLSYGLSINVGATSGSNDLVGLHFDALQGGSGNTMVDAIRFNNAGIAQPYTNALIKAGNTGGAITAPLGIDLSLANFSLFSLKLNGFTVDGTGHCTPKSIVGTTTNDNAPSGAVGEIITANVASGSAVALTSGTPANVTSITLTAGDWDVSATGAFNSSNASATLVSTLIASMSTTSGSLDPGTDATQRGNNLYQAWAALNVGSARIPAGPTRFSLASTTTIFLVASASYSGTGAAVGAFGTIRARRVR